MPGSKPVTVLMFLLVAAFFMVACLSLTTAATFEPGNLLGAGVVIRLVWYPEWKSGNWR